MVSIQSPVALPDPVTLSSVLTAVPTNGAFRNMSGASASGDAANQALDASGKAATSSLNAAGSSLATMLNAFADALSEKPAAEKSLSDAGAAVNKKADEAKKEGTKGGAASDGAGGTDSADSGTDGGGADSQDGGTKTATAALVEKALADQGIVTGAPASSSSNGSAASGTSDPVSAD